MRNARPPRRSAWLFLALSLAAGDARAQAPKASATARPAAPPKGGEALPEGHPPVGAAQGDEAKGGEPLPEGHPPVQGSGPHGGGGGRGLFEPPPDTVAEDPALPPGSIEVQILDADDRPLPGAPVALGILENTVSRGESRSRRAGEADGSGRIRWDGLAVGANVSYRVQTSRGGASYAAAPFALSDTAGKRVRLHAYEVSSSLDDVLVGAQALVFVTLREDALVVEHLFSYFNVGRVAWTPEGAAVRLPEGYKAFNKPDSMDDFTFEEDAGSGKAAMRGTLEPGRHEATFRYQVPLSGDERQTIKIELPPRVAQARVAAEASPSMSLSVEGFPEPERNQNRDGKRVLITERQATRMDGGVGTLEITLSGLPTPGPGRWIAVGLGLGAIGAAALYIGRRRGRGMSEEERTELEEAERALLDEIVELERARARGDVGPESYERLRAALVASLARIERKLPARAERGPREATR